MHNNIELILGICFGFIGINHADYHKISDPVIIERNCTHVKFSFDVQYGQEPLGGEVGMIESDGGYSRIAFTGFDLDGNFYFADRYSNKYDEYFVLKVIPIPKTWKEKHTFFIDFRFPDERVVYILVLKEFKLDRSEEIVFPFEVGKSRCFSEEDITGCDGPTCVCDTVVTKTCPLGPTMTGKCTDSGSITNNSADFTHVACEVDECLSGNNECSENANCTNTVGSYECTCRTGFEGDGINCEDINECALDAAECNENTNCFNFPGSYRCTCKTGYEGDGQNCGEIPGQRLGQSFLLIGGIAVGVIAAIAIGLVIYRKKKKELLPTASNETTTKETFIEK